MKERREWLEVISLDGSIKNVRSGSMPSSPTRKILVPRWNKCTSSHLPKDEKEVRDLQLWVQCTCIVCLGNSKSGKNNCIIVIGQEPRWTKTTPLDYVERRLTRNNCGTIRRFVPVNAGLESLPDVKTQTFYRGNQGLSVGDQLLTLQKYPLQHETTKSKFLKAKKGTGTYRSLTWC